MNSTAILNPAMPDNDSFLESTGFIFHHNEGYGDVYYNFWDTYIIRTHTDHYFIMKDHSKMIFNGTIESQAVLASIFSEAGILTQRSIDRAS